MKVWTETDLHGNTAHHLAAETSNLAVLEVSHVQNILSVLSYHVHEKTLIIIFFRHLCQPIRVAWRLKTQMVLHLYTQVQR